MALWLAISVVQTFVIIPAIVYRWGKGRVLRMDLLLRRARRDAGGRAPGEDAPREALEPAEHDRAGCPRGGVGCSRCCARLVDLARLARRAAVRRTPAGWHPLGVQTNYYWIVDVGFAGILGVGLYFHFSGRVWCRFACPLAALMHIYARFSSFRILADKKKCISCNVCTSVCHQGIDIMSFANKGLPMEDPQCVRCSACVQSCPTGVLTFGRVDRRGAIISVDSLSASPVQRVEAR